jgi:hypothetical protein
MSIAHEELERSPSGDLSSREFIRRTSKKCAVVAAFAGLEKIPGELAQAYDVDAGGAYALGIAAASGGRSGSWSSYGVHSAGVPAKVHL